MSEAIKMVLCALDFFDKGLIVLLLQVVPQENALKGALNLGQQRSLLTIHFYVAGDLLRASKAQLKRIDNAAVW